MGEDWSRCEIVKACTKAMASKGEEVAGWTSRR